MMFDFQHATTADWLSIGPRLVGITFLWAGAIKAFAPHAFARHLASLGWIPWRLQALAVTAAAALEAGWGLALLVNASPGLMLPATVVLLALLTSISWWGVRSGKAKDCGCYGGFIQPSITQSILMNAAFATVAVVSWTTGNRGVGIEMWQLAVILLGILISGGLAEAAQRFERRNDRPMFDTNPLKIGKKWKHPWADGATRRHDGEILVAYLGANCPFCSQFVKIANAMVQSPELPEVIGVMAADSSQVQAYKKDYQIRFPVVTISQSLMARLTRAVPTVVIVNSGIITEMWVGSMPPAVVDRFRDAFFPSVRKERAATAN